MISSTQREALAVLTEVCDLSPDVRLGQLLAHLGFLGEDQTGRSLWDIDDEQLLAILYHHRAELVGRQPDSSHEALRSTGAALSASQGSTSQQTTSAGVSPNL
jgi:hypothetical protein